MTSYALRAANHAIAVRSQERRASLVVLAVAYAAAGVLHLTLPGPFVSITPSWVPWPQTVIQVTGLCELLGAAGLLIPRTRKLAAVMLALYAVCVFPANIKQAFWMAGPDPSPWRWLYHGPRLLIQPVIVWWPLWSARLTTWPGELAHAMLMEFQPASMTVARPTPWPRLAVPGKRLLIGVRPPIDYRTAVPRAEGPNALIDWPFRRGGAKI